MVNTTSPTSAKPSCKACDACCAIRHSTIYAAILFATSISFLLAIDIIIYRLNIDQDVGWIMLLVVLLWGIIFVDAVIGLLRGADYSYQAWQRITLLVLLPPFRMTITTGRQDGCVWLPVWGWRYKDQALFNELERTLNVPMLAIAGLVLPVLAIEIWGKSWQDTYPFLQITARICTSFIWLSFAIDFVLMVSIAEHKIDYCKEHWLDIAIIILPLIAFLRGWQLFRAARLARLSKVARVFRVRGLAMRVYRGLIVLRIIETLLHRNPERRLAGLYRALEKNEKKAEELRMQILELEERLKIFSEK